MENYKGYVIRYNTISNVYEVIDNMFNTFIGIICYASTTISASKTWIDYRIN